jgi:pimeloyl-ACP methyl ester carboxylesterase
VAGRWDEERGSIAVGDRRLACALTRVSGDEPHPAVLLLPPLGARSRTAPLYDAPPSDGLAFLLRGAAEAGFVTVRVDPSGVGDSDGPPYADASLALELEGYRASLAWLAALPFVDPRGVFVLGHSLGGVLAPLVAETTTEVAGFVVYGAPSRRWVDTLAAGAFRQLVLAGLVDEALDREARCAAQLYELLLREGAGPEDVVREHPALASCRAAADVSGARLHGRSLTYFRALDQVDPEAAWRRVRAPVLALHGEHDWIVADDDHLRIAAWSQSTGRAAVALTLPGLDHDLLSYPSREASFINRGRGRVDRCASRAILSWMVSLYAGDPG